MDAPPRHRVRQVDRVDWDSCTRARPGWLCSRRLSQREIVGVSSPSQAPLRPGPARRPKGRLDGACLPTATTNHLHNPSTKSTTSCQRALVTALPSPPPRQTRPPATRSPRPPSRRAANSSDAADALSEPSSPVLSITPPVSSTSVGGNIPPLSPPLLSPSLPRLLSAIAPLSPPRASSTPW